MKRLISAGVAAVIVLAGAAVPLSASAHGAPPCNDSGDPGNSDYAQHHIVFLATSGGLGGAAQHDGAPPSHEGHVPGSHQGFSLCLGVH